MRVPNAADETGVALLAAMFALAVIGALVAGSFFAGRLEQQSGHNVTYARQAGEAAEAGLVETAAALEAPALEELVAGGVPLEMGTSRLEERVTVHSSVARLTSRLFMVRARGTRHDAVGGALATRTLGLLVQLGAGTDSAAVIGNHQTVIPLAERSWVRLY